MVIESLRKEKLLKKIEDDIGVKPREYRMMNHYFKYLIEMVDAFIEKEIKQATKMTIEWNKQSVFNIL